MYLFLNHIWQRFRSQKGQAMSEYGLVLAIAAVGVIAVLVLFRNELVSLFTNITNSIKTTTTTTPSTGG